MRIPARTCQVKLCVCVCVGALKRSRVALHLLNQSGAVFTATPSPTSLLLSPPPSYLPIPPSSCLPVSTKFLWLHLLTPPQLYGPAFFTGRTPHGCLSGVCAYLCVLLCVCACVCTSCRDGGLMVFIKGSRPPVPGLLRKAGLNISRETVHSSSLCVAVGGLCV